MRRVAMGGQNGCADVFAMYMRLGMRMRDGDTIGEELQDGDAQMRQLCSAVGDRMMPKSKLRYETMRNRDWVQWWFRCNPLLAKGSLLHSQKHGIRPSSKLLVRTPEGQRLNSILIIACHAPSIYYITHETPQQHSMTPPCSHSLLHHALSMCWSRCASEAVLGNSALTM